ncbi:hypothetical protein EDC01DRAFT_321732 [Geopyxis carbonaria]|nr:hypothetical protein EDC01DRAFT_321732 [Geopyxis carbonaria]
MPLATKPWLTLFSLSLAVPTLLLAARIYFDLRLPTRSRSASISLGLALAAHLCLVIGSSMALYRNARKGSIPMVPHNLGQSGYEEWSLGLPLTEATIMHSYIIPTGLWLCKASFVAMYFSLSQHVSSGLRRLLYAAVAYLLVSYLLLMGSHALWCGSFFKTWTSTPSSACTPFTTAAPIALYAFANITSWILIILTPLLMLRQAGGATRPRERYAVAFLVFLGTAAVATTATCCALHITYRKRLLSYYGYVQLAELLACLELAVAVAAVSLPSLRAVLYRRHDERQRRSEAGSARAKWDSGLSSAGLSGGFGTPRSARFGGAQSRWSAATISEQGWEREERELGDLEAEDRGFARTVGFEKDQEAGGGHGFGHDRLPEEEEDARSPVPHTPI